LRPEGLGKFEFDIFYNLARKGLKFSGKIISSCQCAIATQIFIFFIKFFFSSLSHKKIFFSQRKVHRPKSPNTARHCLFLNLNFWRFLQKWLLL
jgi:hypothetical protein